MPEYYPIKIASITVSNLSSVRSEKAARIEALHDPNILLFFSDFADWTQDSIKWQPPTTFTVYVAGAWTVTIGRLYNGYDNYKFWERHFSVRWFMTIDYQNDAGTPLYQGKYDVGTEGYKGGTSDIVREGFDPRVREFPGITSGTARQSFETFIDP